MKYLCTFILLALLFVYPEITYSQPGLPGPPSQAPIDGGLLALAAGGGAYALKKLSGKDKK
ncbi:PID-CTERM protein-sorting domain-containing protein [Halalkalibaculum sp. DA3122]|uniref:PID-CTERM protein-sorting domain-containing protein n=1 Tax=unclassified Halalkalibaculum TaxID=2964617 RepID=UPI0037540880